MLHFVQFVEEIHHLTGSGLFECTSDADFSNALYLLYGVWNFKYNLNLIVTQEIYQQTSLANLYFWYGGSLIKLYVQTE